MAGYCTHCVVANTRGDRTAYPGRVTKKGVQAPVAPLEIGS